MTHVGNCPYGFEDGNITRYQVEGGRLEMTYQFWNEKTGVLRFDDLVAVHDQGAVGVSVGRLTEVSNSELLRLLVRRHFDVAPANTDWRHFQFLDVDDGVMFEVVAKSCSFAESHS